MKKKFLSITLLCLPAGICSAQSLFFDCMKDCVWVTEEKYDEPTFRTEWDIFLQRWSAPVDSLNSSGTVWCFGDELSLRYYNARTKQDKPIKTYQYSIDKDKGQLVIVLNDKEQLTYEVGITSTGNTAGLYKMKRRKKEQ